jgi:hypothetical protein
MDIKLNCTGEIITGAHAGWFTRIIAENDGYLIIIASKPDFGASSEGFDQWVENRDNLEAQIAHYGWEIYWLDDD